MSWMPRSYGKFSKIRIKNLCLSNWSSASPLAVAAGLAASYLSSIENGKKPGSVKAMKRIAAALNISVDDLI